MSLESEARRRLEEERRAKEQRHTQYEAQGRALHIEAERAKSEAISKFKSLNPEKLLEEVRQTWHTGRIIGFSDPLYHISSIFFGIDGVMLYQQGSNEHLHSRYTIEKPTVDGWLRLGWDHDSSSGPSEPPGSIIDIDTDTYPVNFARISLVGRQQAMKYYYEVVTEDRSGNYRSEKKKAHIKTGWFSTKTEESGQNSYNFNDFRQSKSFDIHNVTYGDIRSFFVQTTAARMAGAGNLRIR